MNIFIYRLKMENPIGYIYFTLTFLVFADIIFFSVIDDTTCRNNNSKKINQSDYEKENNSNGSCRADDVGEL
jgi:hypothetical protein